MSFVTTTKIMLMLLLSAVNPVQVIGRIGGGSSGGSNSTGDTINNNNIYNNHTMMMRNTYFAKTKTDASINTTQRELSPNWGNIVETTDNINDKDQGREFCPNNKYNDTSKTYYLKHVPTGKFACMFGEDDGYVVKVLKDGVNCGPNGKKWKVHLKENDKHLFELENVGTDRYLGFHGKNLNHRDRVVGVTTAKYVMGVKRRYDYECLVCNDEEGNTDWNSDHGNAHIIRGCHKSKIRMWDDGKKYHLKKASNSQTLKWVKDNYADAENFKLVDVDEIFI